MAKRTNTAVWIEKYSRWQINVQKDNERKCFTSYKPGRTGQRECNSKADSWLDENIHNTSMRVSEACTEYLSELKKATGKGNYRNYESFIRVHINPKVGKLKLESLTERHLQSIINDAYARGLAKKTLKSIRACINSILKFCRISRYSTLTGESLTIPKGAITHPKTILQPEDLKVLFSDNETLYRRKVVNDSNIYAYRFQVITGLRPGELIGMKWSDIKGDMLRLQRAINVLGDTTQGKNENACRTFKLIPLAKEILENQKQYQKSAEIKSEYVFSNQYGDPMIEDRYYDSWIRYRKYHDLSKSHLYELRHTFVSMVKSLPEGYLKELVGHSKDMDTYGVYAHTFSDDMSITANMVQNIIENVLKK
jgi:integrase